MIESGRSGKGSEVVFRVDWARKSGMDEEWDGRRVGWMKRISIQVRRSRES